MSFICDFIIAESFNWIGFIFLLCFILLDIGFDLISTNIIKNSKEVLNERYLLYKIIKSKENNIEEILNKLINDRNNIIKYRIFELYNKKGKINLSDNEINNLVTSGEICEKTNINCSIKTKRKINKYYKMYNSRTDFDDIMRQYYSKELISKNSISVIGSFISIVGFILGVLGFFKINYGDLADILTNIVFFVIMIIIIIVSSIEMYCNNKKECISRYKKLQTIFKEEKFII